MIERMSNIPLLTYDAFDNDIRRVYFALHTLILLCFP